jgi:hypothetical protein
MPAILFDRPWKRLLWFAAIPALAYLPSAIHLTYYRDDWYYAYDALVGSNSVFRLMFASDRPARGPFFELYQSLFGMAPLPYHLMMYAWRLAGGLCVVWLVRLLWPRRGAAAWGAGLLFALYPGFTWWVAGIEYQPMVASAALMVLSLALTLGEIRWSGRPRLRIAAIVGAILAGWLYLALVEYAAGTEALRLALIFAIVAPAEASSFWRRSALAVRRWLIYLLIPVGFFVWRFVLFTSQRRATDLGAQLGAFQGDPISTGLHWFVSLVLSFVNVVLAAWVVPLTNNFFSGSLREVLIGLAVAILAALAAWFLLTHSIHLAGQAGASSGDWARQAVWLGLAAIFLGIIPIIVVNREITFPNFSHYALPASLGVALAVTGLVFMLTGPAARVTVLSAAVLLSAMTHQGLGTSALREERIVAGFWQQVAWRAPALAEGTTLLAYYPGVSYADDTDIVWGPANYVYDLRPQTTLPVMVSISALTPDVTSYNNLLLGHETQTSTYRAHTTTADYSRALILVQSAEDSCVRVIDPRWPTFSTTDDPSLQLLASTSHPETIEVTHSPVVPPKEVFGREPPHAWCFYFQKASLAGQQGDWQRVAALQDDVDRLGLHPNDQVEWMPFLQAQTYLGDLQAVKGLASRVNTEKLYKQEACKNLHAMPDAGYPLPPEAETLVNGLFCGGQP